VNARDPRIMFLAAIAATGAAIGLAIGGHLPQALILAAGAAFLAVWAQRERGS
jgi:hypothetical protein